MDTDSTSEDSDAESHHRSLFFSKDLHDANERLILQLLLHKATLRVPGRVLFVP